MYVCACVFVCVVENFLLLRQFVFAEVSVSVFAGRLAASFIFHSAVLATLVSIILKFFVLLLL